MSEIWKAIGNPYWHDDQRAIFHGDAAELLSRLPAGSLDLVLTSPPYNCRMPYGEPDEVPWPAYYAAATRWIGAAYGALRDGGTLAVNVPGVVRWQSQHRHADTWSDFDPSYRHRRDGEIRHGKGRIEPIAERLTGIMRACDPHLREPIIWVKGEVAINNKYQMGCDSDPFCRPAHEMILLGSKSRWFHRGGTGRRGKDALPWLDECKDVWFLDPRSDTCHPAVFPLEIPRRLMRLFVHADDAVVCDPFLGSGTTLLAARERGLAAIGIEREERFCELAAKRLRQRVLF